MVKHLFLAIKFFVCFDETESNSFTISSCPDFILEPVFGRLDSEDCSTQTDAEFPNPVMSYGTMMDYFKKQLDMTEEEVPTYLPTYLTN